ncbi:hypothetical protein AQUCO_00100818v1 [Aquilegia coerulea]|uniref:Bidirectional sugar transporter SWEET n=1 Tax=Aquilegia coerulea TaxID=218851 RepID=A0A2G5FC45_AQUCA|nr:hypothetical protein AQUCO_00100818v1 [Aquilegia coerulea]
MFYFFTGQVTSLFLFAAPIATLVKIWKRKDVEEFSPNPYLAGVMNCLMWIYYGLPFVTGKNTLVITINSVGLVLEFIYIGIFLWYCKTKKQRVNVLWKLGAIVGIFVLAAGLELGLTHKGFVRLTIAGVQSTVFSICLYAMPLDVMRMVIKTKSVEYLPLPLCIAGLLNGIDWSAYALFSKKIDPYILTANGLGAILGIVQVILYIIYCRSTPQHSKNPTDQKQVELSNNELIV